MPSAPRSDHMRLPVKVRCIQEQPPPWQDNWVIEMDGVALTQLSAELLSLPDPLPPRLHQLRRLIENLVSRGLENHPADWEDGTHPATRRVFPDKAWEPGRKAAAS